MVKINIPIKNIAFIETKHGDQYNIRRVISGYINTINDRKHLVLYYTFKRKKYRTSIALDNIDFVRDKEGVNYTNI